MSSKLLKKQLRSFVNQEHVGAASAVKALPSQVVSGSFKPKRDGRKQQRQMLQLQTKSYSYTQQRVAIEQENMKHNLFVFNRSNQPTQHQLEVAQLLLPKKVPEIFPLSSANAAPLMLFSEGNASRKAQQHNW